MTGTSGLGAEGLDNLLSDTRRLIDSMRTSAPTDNGEPPEGVGTAMDGAIRCTAGLPGLVTSLELDPKVMRHASRDLAHHVAEAVNAALADLRAKVTGTVTPVDPNVLSAQVAQLQDESIRQMERFTSAIGLAIEQIRRRT
jgi:YbaB/EbfC DNA-binding family